MPLVITYQLIWILWHSEHAHASYPGLSVQPLYGVERKESSGTGLMQGRPNNKSAIYFNSNRPISDFVFARRCIKFNLPIRVRLALIRLRATQSKRRLNFNRGLALIRVLNNIISIDHVQECESSFMFVSHLGVLASRVWPSLCVWCVCLLNSGLCFHVCDHDRLGFGMLTVETAVFDGICWFSSSHDR